MLPRVLEPEVMDTAEEAADYDAMDHSEVNRRFAAEALAAWRASPAARRGPTSAAAARQPAEPPVWLDVGAGTAQIPIELCRQDGDIAVLAIDRAREMLRLARRNVAAAELDNRIALAALDAKRLPFPAGAFGCVVSNSIVHHLANPEPAALEMTRVLSRGGLLFVRDLARPATEGDLERLVAAYAGGATPRQRQLFRQSLHAALTVEEAADLAARCGWPPDAVQMTSDRHWTLSAVRG